jgi:hypothetical protein
LFASRCKNPELRMSATGHKRTFSKVWRDVRDGGMEMAIKGAKIARAKTMDGLSGDMD